MSAIASETAPAAPTNDSIQNVRLRGLNKLTAQSEMLEAPLGTLIRFGNLEILTRACENTQGPSGKQEASTLLDVYERKPGENPEPQLVFRGWLFSASPSVSGIEHPLYDLTAIACTTGEAAD